MKTLKNFFACLKAEIKKNFFSVNKAAYKTRCIYRSHDKKVTGTDADLIRMEEYVSKYRTTTRWQTV